MLVEKEVAELVWSSAEALNPQDYALLDLHVRRGLANEELADELGLSAGALHTRLSRLRRSFEDALTTVLLAQRGRRDCEELDRLLLELDAPVTSPQGRRAVQAHVRDCETCQESRRRYVTAAEILAGLAPVPLVPGLQDEIWRWVSEATGAVAGGKRRKDGRQNAGQAAGGGAAAGAAAVVSAGRLGSAAHAVTRLLPAGTAGPHDPKVVWSPDHDAGVPSSAARVRMAWTSQPKAAAYSVLWSHGARDEPNTTPDLPGTARGTVSPRLAPGRWFFHLRTEDRSGRWTDTVHRGPYVIVPPPAPERSTTTTTTTTTATPRTTTTTTPKTTTAPTTTAPITTAPTPTVTTTTTAATTTTTARSAPAATTSTAAQTTTAVTTTPTTATAPAPALPTPPKSSTGTQQTTAAPSGGGSGGGGGGGPGTVPGGSSGGSGSGPAGPSNPPGGGAFRPPPADTAPPSGQGVELDGGPYFRSASVALSLDQGSDGGSGVDPASGIVQRTAGVLTGGSCRGWSASWQTVSLQGHADPGVVGGRCYRYRYSVADRAGNRSPFSAPSGAAMVDTTAPDEPVLSLAAGGPDTAVSGVTVFYRPAGGGGSFTVSAVSADAGSGLRSIGLPTVGGGVTPTAVSRTASPAAVTYTWPPGSTAEGPREVTASDRAGNESSAYFAVVPDSAGPVGMSVRASAGPWSTSGSVPLLVEPGADAASGVDPGSVTVERDSAPLANGACGAFPGSWTAVSPANGADTVGTGRCYRYRVGVSDRVGNRAASAASDAVRVDSSPPSAPTLTLSESSSRLYATGARLYYRPGGSAAFSVQASTGDAESGIASVAFPRLDGASGGGSVGSAPFSATYTLSDGFDASGRQTVTARNGAGLSAGADFTLVRDSDGPAGVSVSASPGQSGLVQLTIDEGNDDGSGLDSGSLVVERDSAPLSQEGCGDFSGDWSRVTLHDGADTDVSAGVCYRYRVTVSDRVGNNSGAVSGEVRLEGSPPQAPELTLSESSPQLFVSGTTLFYRPGKAETPPAFSVEASAGDPSQIAAVVFPVLTGAEGGGEVTEPPYSATYTLSGGFDVSGPQTVKVTNGLGLSAGSDFTLVPDSKGPTGLSVQLLGKGPYPGAAVPIAVDAGDDAQSGLDKSSIVVERDSAPLGEGGCGEFTDAWKPIELHGAADTNVSSGTCYRYRVRAADDVGNESVSDPSADAQVVDRPSAA